MIKGDTKYKNGDTNTTIMQTLSIAEFVQFSVEKEA